MLTCNRAGPYGAFPGQTPPHILSFSSSLYLDSSIWCTFPELFYRCENSPPNGRCSLLDDHEHMVPRPPGARGLIMLTPVTSPCCLTISQSENCTGWSHNLRHTSFIWLLKMLCRNLWGELGVFFEHEPPVPLHGPAINLPLLQTPTFRFVWSHCASGKRTCANRLSTGKLSKYPEELDKTA